MRILRKLGKDEVAEILWDWNHSQHFLSCLFKELVRHDGEYYAAEARIESVEDFLSLMLRDQGPSRCLTPEGASHRLLDVIGRMNEQEWTFESLAIGGECVDIAGRDRGWYQKCVNLDPSFDLHKMGLLAVHPRSGSKHQTGEEDNLVASAHEIYEGQHRALVLAKKLVMGEMAFDSLDVLYLWPDRPTS